MIVTVQHIPIEEIVASYSRSLSKNEKIDNFLDQVNQHRENLNTISQTLDELSNLLTKITWIENFSEKDEILTKGILTIGKAANKHFEKFYALNKNIYLPQGLLQEELKRFKKSMSFHLETIKEVEHIIFVLRKDKEFVDLCNMIDEI